MANTMTRRPLPALISLLALLILTAIVWWRVADRAGSDTGSGSPRTPSPTPTCTSTSVGSAPTPPVVTVRPSAVTVRVLNSTDRTGLAGTVRRTLVSDGFRSPDPASNDSATVRITASAQIRYGAGSAAARQGALLLQYYFPGSVTKAVSGSSATVTVSVGDGFRAVASPQAVAKAVTAASRSTGTPSTPGTAASASAAGAC